MAGKTAWKSATPQLSLVLPGAPASQFHSKDVEIRRRQAGRSGSLIRQALYLDQEDAYAAGEVGFLIAEKRELWWDPRPGQGEAAWGSHVLLSERFFREATEAPVPLDLRVLRALRSPFEIDIYVWLTWRFFRLRKPVTIPWASLALQFGCGYANPRHFKKRFLGYVKSVIDYYPEVRLESLAAGLILKPSPTPIVQRPGAGAELLNLLSDTTGLVERGGSGSACLRSGRDVLR